MPSRDEDLQQRHERRGRLCPGRRADAQVPLDTPTPRLPHTSIAPHFDRSMPELPHPWIAPPLDHPNPRIAPPLNRSTPGLPHLRMAPAAPQDGPFHFHSRQAHLRGRRPEGGRARSQYRGFGHHHHGGPTHRNQSLPQPRHHSHLGPLACSAQEELGGPD